MSNVYKILRKLDPKTLPQDMRGMGFSYKILPDLSGKDLRGCIFYKCNPKLDNEDCIQTDTVISILYHNKNLILRDDEGYISLRRENLIGAYLQKLDLREADLQDANLHSATLRGIDLRGAYLQHSILVDADLKWADLRHAELWGANLKGADLEGATLEGARLAETHLQGANFLGADLKMANLYEANLRGANLAGANLKGSNLYEANLRDAIYDDTSKKYFSKEQLSVMRHISEEHSR